MGIAHGDDVGLPHCSVYSKGLPLKKCLGIKALRKPDRDGAGFKDRLSHIDSCATDLAVFHEKPGHLYARACFYTDHVTLGKSVLMGIPGHAAGGIAAHFGLGSVGIEDAHPDIGHVRGTDKDQSVSAYAAMPVRNDLGDFGRIINMLGKAVHVDIVVAAAVHLGKGKGLAHVCFLVFPNVPAGIQAWRKKFVWQQFLPGGRGGKKQGCLCASLLFEKRRNGSLKYHAPRKSSFPPKDFFRGGTRGFDRHECLPCPPGQPAISQLLYSGIFPQKFLKQKGRLIAKCFVFPRPRLPGRDEGLLVCFAWWT